MAFSLGEYQDIFLEEADDLLQELNQDLLQMEKNPDDADMINNIFRAAHTLKSSAAFVGLTDLSELAHEMENLLQGIRDGSMKVSQDIVDVIFKCFDEISGVIGSISEGKKPDRDLSILTEEIKRIGGAAKATAGEPMNDASGKVLSDANKSYKVPSTKLEVADLKKIKAAADKGIKCFELAVYVDPLAQMKSLKMQLVIANLESRGEILQSFPEAAQLETGNVFKIIILTSDSKESLVKLCDIDQIIKIVFRILSFEKRDDGKMAARFNADGEFVIGTESAPADFSPKQTGGAKKTSGGDDTIKKQPVLKTIRVSIEKLDQLMNNVGELVIVNSGFYSLYEDLLHTVADKTLLTDFKNRMDQMSMVEKDLQSGIMKTRMVPIGDVFDRFNRLVRDLSREDHKDIQLVITGEDTEIDKKVIDSIGEPLMHLLRNAVDHGIESAEERQALGKPEAGTVTLNAYQSGSQIYVEVSDDGRGLDVEVIRKKAIEKKLVEPEAAAEMSDDEIFSFIFVPGFSTAKKITDISGRGVGMNVVKEAVNELNGNVRIQSEKNVGTTFILEFPLTLAIIPAILVNVGGEQYAIPLSDVDETINISYSDISTVEGHEVVNLRGDVLSLLRLSRFVGARSTLTQEDKIPIVVITYLDRKIGLLVDVLGGKTEIVIKSLEQNYKPVPGLAGASIMGDGSVCLIIDVATMVSLAISDQDGFYSGRWIFDGELSDRTQETELAAEDLQEIQKDIDEDFVSEQPAASAGESIEPESESSEEELGDSDIEIEEVVPLEMTQEQALLAKAEEDWRKLLGEEEKDTSESDEGEEGVSPDEIESDVEKIIEPDAEAEHFANVMPFGEPEVIGDENEIESAEQAAEPEEPILSELSETSASEGELEDKLKEIEEALDGVDDVTAEQIIAEHPADIIESEEELKAEFQEIEDALLTASESEEQGASVEQDIVSSKLDAADTPVEDNQDNAQLKNEEYNAEDASEEFHSVDTVKEDESSHLTETEPEPLTDGDEYVDIDIVGERSVAGTSETDVSLEGESKSLYATADEATGDKPEEQEIHESISDAEPAAEEYGEELSELKESETITDSDSLSAGDDEIVIARGDMGHSKSETVAKETADISAESNKPAAEIKQGPAVTAELELMDQSLVDEVKVALDEFRKELKRNVKTTVDDGSDEMHIMGKSIDFSTDALRHLQSVANVGAANAAEAMSKILSRRIDLSIPEVNVCPISQIPEKTGCTDVSSYIGVILPIKEETPGAVLFIFDKEEAFSLINTLYANHPDIAAQGEVADEYRESILKEITNIVGSSVLNVICEKIGMTVQPEVPSSIFSDISAILNSDDTYSSTINGYVIVMDTSFFFESDRLIGHLILLPGEDVAKSLVFHLSSDE